MSFLDTASIFSGAIGPVGVITDANETAPTVARVNQTVRARSYKGLSVLNTACGVIVDVAVLLVRQCPDLTMSLMVTETTVSTVVVNESRKGRSFPN